MRKALLIGINKYPNYPLDCCLNDCVDLEKVLSRNEDNSKNFQIKKMFDEDCTQGNIRKNIKELFSGNDEIALLYFSGHGFDDENDGIVVSYDYCQDNYGIRMSEILSIVSKSKCNFKIIILDCCHSGFAGGDGVIGDTSILNDGTIIMTASKKNQTSIEINGHGVFTNLLIEALKGGASDILGNITPGSIYAYIDQALGTWNQRPLFKANISSFVPLRNANQKISISQLKEALSLFNSENDIFKLDPSYEKTNIKNGEHKNIPPYADNEHVKLMTILQICNRNSLIEPYNCTDMYFAAMEFKGCKLTQLGKHYWNMIKGEII